VSAFSCGACGASASEFDVCCPSCGGALPEGSYAGPSTERPRAPAAEIPSRIARYEILGRLGAGGMGVVYRAIDPELGRPAAVKVLPPVLAGDARAKARLLREAQAASLLDHPGIASVYEVGEDEGQIFVAMELCEGETLRDRLARGPMDADEALPILRQIAGALDVAHRAGIVHRDIKPSNIMLMPGGQVRLLDFGLAKLTGERDAPDGPLTEGGELIGTPAYMSPEQLRGEEVDARTDLWALGVVAHEMLGGASPFAGPGGRVAMVTRVLVAAPAPLDARRAPDGFERLLAWLLCKPREDRCPSAAEAVRALDAIAAGEHAGAIPLPPPVPVISAPPPVRAVRRGRRWIRAALLAAAALVAGAGGLALALRRPAAADHAAGGRSRAVIGAGAAAYVELAEARSRLGQDAKAREAADRAIELAAGLDDEGRLSIEARAHMARQDWDQAAGLYRALHGFFPDRLDFGLGLAAAQTRGAHGKLALGTVDELRKLPHAAADDARLDLAEAEAAESFSDWRRTQEAAARAAQGARAGGQQLLLADALLRRVRADVQLGALDEAAAGATEARAIAAAAGDTHLEGRAVSGLALVAKARGALDEYRRLLEEVLAQARRAGDWRNTAVALNNLAIAARRDGDTETARRLYEEVIAGDRAMGNRANAALTLGNLGVALDAAADVQGARRAWEEALAEFRVTGDAPETARMLTSLGGAALRTGDLGRARELREEALALARKVGDKTQIASCLGGLAWVDWMQGDLAAARGRLEEAAAVQDQLGPPGGAGKRLQLAELALDEGRPEATVAVAGEIAGALSTGDRAVLEALLARAALAQGRVRDAADHAAQAAKLTPPRGGFYDRMDTELAGAEVAAAQGRRDEAARRFAAVLAEAERRGLVDLGLKTRLRRAGSERRYGDAAAARVQLAALERDAEAAGFLLFSRRAAALQGGPR
jgi:tetratricopeptide (TPR) repeat protein